MARPDVLSSSSLAHTSLPDPTEPSSLAQAGCGDSGAGPCHQGRDVCAELHSALCGTWLRASQSTCHAPGPCSVPQSPAWGGLTSPGGTGSGVPRPHQGPPAESRGGRRRACAQGPARDTRDQGNGPVWPTLKRSVWAPFLFSRKDRKRRQAGSPGTARVWGRCRREGAPTPAGCRGRDGVSPAVGGAGSTGPAGTETRPRRVPRPVPLPACCTPAPAAPGPARPSWARPRPARFLP